MRIRKRWRPPPAASSAPHLPLSPPEPQPLPDLHHHHGQKFADNENLTPPCDSPKEIQVQRLHDPLLLTDQPIEAGEDDDFAEKDRSTETVRSIPCDLSAEPSVAGNWCEEDRAIPLKKRRVTFESKGGEETIVGGQDKKKMNRTTRMKRSKDWVDEENDKNGEKEDGLEENTAKKRGNGSTTMAGSRCSRVNGKGWRCCQQTLVGYSLCEHHLSMVRLRSTSSVRPRAAQSAPISHPKKVENSLYLEDDGSDNYDDDDDDGDGDGDDEGKGLMVAKKRKKIGVVKARSISSLLGQTVPYPPATLQLSAADNSANQDTSVMV